MMTRYACAIDGQGLQDVDPTIIITDIQETVPKVKATTSTNAVYQGLQLTRLQRQSLSVTVSFEVHEYSTARRKAVAEEACEWAKDGWLTISDRPDQRLYVVCDKLPVVTSALKWTDKLSIGFTAYALPYWQEIFPASATYSGTSGVVSLSPAGTVDCYLEGDITATGGTVNTLTIAANGRTFAFSGLGLTSGKTLSIGYDDEHHWQYMRIGDTSALSKRTEASADDIMLHPRTVNAITVTANAPVQARFGGRGLWR